MSETKLTERHKNTKSNQRVSDSFLIFIYTHISRTGDMGVLFLLILAAKVLTKMRLS
jgi:hypothetical protein